MSRPSRTRASSSSRVIGTASALIAPWPALPRSRAGEATAISGWRNFRSILSSQYHWDASVETPTPGTPWRRPRAGARAVSSWPPDRILISSFTAGSVLGRSGSLQLELEDVVAEPRDRVADRGAGPRLAGRARELAEL